MRQTHQVWDIAVRVGHWSLATAVIVAYATQEGPTPIHDLFGYLALAIVALRIGWGFTGSRYARFRQFLYGPRTTLLYARKILTRTEPHYTGHNPLGGWMILATLIAVSGASITGWLYTTDRFWGDETVERIHAYFGHALVPLVVLHIAGVLFTSWRQRENLIAAMWHGRKIKRPDPDER